MTKTMLKDALRYIGTPIEKADVELVRKVEISFKLLEQIATPRMAYEQLTFKVEDETVFFEGTPFKIESSDLIKLFTHSKSCFIMAVTLGTEIDRQIGIRQKLDMLDAVILDACASVLVEKVCDDLEQQLMEKLKEDEFLTMRFSPGYGNVPLGSQRVLLDILQAEKRIGLTLTKTDMMVPTKSITAIIGISNQKENREKSCGNCNLVKTCAYRRRGDRCGL